MTVKVITETVVFSAEIEGRWQEVATAADLARVKMTVEEAERVAADARASIRDVGEEVTVQIGGGFGAPAAVLQASSDDSALDVALLKTIGFVQHFSPIFRSHVSSREIGAAEGGPPRTKGLPGKNLRDSIKVTVNSDGSATVGCDQDIIGPIGDVLEFGLFFRGRKFQAHPFLRPAMARQLSNFAANWTDRFFFEN